MTEPTNLRSHVDRVATSRAMFMKYSSHDALFIAMAGDSLAYRAKRNGHWYPRRMTVCGKSRLVPVFLAIVFAAGVANAQPKNKPRPAEGADVEVAEQLYT